MNPFNNLNDVTIDTDVVCPELQELLASRDPVIFLLTDEEDRGIFAARQALAMFMKDVHKQTHTWTCTEGVDGDGTHRKPPEILGHIRDQTFTDKKARNTPNVWVLIDFHPYLKEPVARRMIKDLHRDLKGTRTSIIFLSPSIDLPDGFDRRFNVVRLELPTRPEMAELVRFVVTEETSSAGTKADRGKFEKAMAKKDVDPAMVDALMGLPDGKARLAVRRSMVFNDNTIVVGDLLEAKKRELKNSGVLELLTPTLTFDDVGGYDIVVEYLRRRRKAFTVEGRKFIGAFPRGVTLLGISGSGKSVLAKACGGEWGLPLVRLDFGRIFGSLVGQSEERMRQVLEIVERQAPCVLWCDEADKMFSGMARGGGDSGVGSRVLASYLTWLQERTEPVFVISTANDISALPPELMRKGRVDETFFFDLPTGDERQHIFKVHLQRRFKQGVGVLPLSEYDLAALSAASDGFVGSEIENTIIDALYDGFDAGGDPVTTDDLVQAARSIVPLSKTHAGVVTSTREWAKGRCRWASSQSARSLGMNPKVIDVSHLNTDIELEQGALFSLTGGKKKEGKGARS